MIPRWPLLAAVGGLALAGVLPALVPALARAWWFAAGALLVAALADAGAALLTRRPRVERRVAHSLSLAAWAPVELTVRNVARRRLTVRLYDHHPSTFLVRDAPFTATAPAGHFRVVAYSVRPTQRGPCEFALVELRIASPLGLWWRRCRLPIRDEVRVYPNYDTISKLLAYEVDNKLAQQGVRLSRRRGEGIEFHQLREYREGDTQRVIDWKATARMRRLISREYQDERDQQLVFLLDGGRRMLTKDGELSHFDHALNAMLLLSYVALRHGDAAGVMTAGERNTWLPPRKGMAAVNALLNHVYDIQPRPIEIDYVGAATELAVRQRRRSLLVILTNVREEDSDDLRVATGLLRRRHLVIVASLRERALDDTLARPIREFDDALAYASTSMYLQARRESQNLLRARGLFVEDCLTDELPAAITSRYLAIKRAGLL